MFNLKNQNNPTDLLDHELVSFDIVIGPRISVGIGDEMIESENLVECSRLINEAISEIKEHLWSRWHDLRNLSEVICNSSGQNLGSLENLLFLNGVKKIYFLSKRFSDLNDISESIKKLFYIDIVNIPSSLIIQFNHLYLSIKILHNLIMREIYRLFLIKRYQKISKTAQISGPWSNLDLPMEERVWSAEEDEEYFADREKARKDQVRYNPEVGKLGYFYIWQDLARGPYDFNDMAIDSPYKSRLLLSRP
jgi:hypothetical protein